MKTMKLKQLCAILMVAGLSFGVAGCKSSKKAMQAEQEAKLAREREAKLKKEEAERAKKAAEAEEAKKAPYKKIESAFNSVANASSVDAANASIQEALTLFSSPDAPLLISISKNGDAKDYDKPTTIKKYLEYLKDQKKNVNTLDNLVFDEQGKIKEIELRKR
jgi:uncharacterized Zn finger protein